MPDEPLRAAGSARPFPAAGSAGPATEIAAPRLTGYEMRAEIGRSGDGVRIVYKAFDRAIGRDVAIKTLIPGRPFDAAAAARFDAEASVTARLQHPSVPPVFDVGRFPDGRPYMVMKLVHGRNLSTLLKERPSPVHGLTRVVAAFEQICQAIGFAHARGVVHRDIKPSNVMIGEFGEVQVMDWGLAKQAVTVGSGWLSDGESTERMPAVHPGADVTQAGQPLGTPAYMAPEQARGQWDKVGPWSDVFALGGVLADILTGRPPFVADTAFNTLVLAGTGNVSEAFARLDASGADPALVALAKRCLAPEPQHRPADAKALAEAVSAYRAGVEARLRKAEAERATSAAKEQEAYRRAEAEALGKQEAEERAEEAARRAAAVGRSVTDTQRKKRYTQLALAGAVALLACGAGAFAWWQSGQARQRAAEKRELQARADAEGGADEARERARAALKSALELRAQHKFREAADALVQAEKSAVGLDDLSAEVKKAKADTAFARDLDAVRAKKWAWVPNPGGDGGKFDTTGVPAEYAKVFSARGFAFNPSTDPPAVARRVAESAVRADILRALDDWALTETKDTATAEKVFEVAFRASPLNDPAARLRDPKVRHDDDQLKRLLDDGPAVTETAPAALLAAALIERRKGNPLPPLMVAQAKFPLDFDTTFDLAVWNHVQALRAPERAEFHVRTAAGHYRTARALRPDHPTTLTNLGILHNMLNEPAAAVAVLKEAIKVHTGDHVAHFNLGAAFQAMGDLNEAEAEYRKTTELSPNYAFAHNNRGTVLTRLKRHQEAGREFEQAIKLGPNDALFRANFGAFLVEVRKPDEAIPHLKKAIEMNPKLAHAHHALGVALEQKKDTAGAHAAYNEAIKLDPKQYAELAKKLSPDKPPEKPPAKPPEKK